MARFEKGSAVIESASIAAEMAAPTDNRQSDDRQNGIDHEQRERELQQANDFHTVLLAMAGHDLRQPLQAMTAAYDWLERRLTSGSEREYLRRGRWALSKLSNQLDMLIEALRLHQHSASIRPEPVALESVFARVWRDNEDLASRKGLALRARARRAVVMSDAVLLEGILCNLVRNALRYTGPGGRVLVGCRRRGSLLRIEVHDTGVGIPPDKLSQIFDAFYRLDSTQADGFGPEAFCRAARCRSSWPYSGGSF